MPKISTVDYRPSEASSVYAQYISLLNKSIKVFIDFHNQHISPEDSSAIFGKLLIIDARRSVLCKNLDTSIENVTNLFEGVTNTYRSTYPNGLNLIHAPQIELYDPSGEKAFYYVQLGIDAYEAISRKKQALARR